MTNVFIEALLKFPKPGYNYFEETWHYETFLSQQEQVEALAKLAKKVSAGLNIPVSDATALLIKAGEKDTEAMARLGDWLNEVNQMNENLRTKNLNSDRKLATMMLCSRLPLQWVLDNQEMLEETYCIELPPDKAKSPDTKGAVDYARLENLKRKEWLDSQDRWAVMQSITAMLTGEIEELADYALNERNRGKPPAEPVKPEAPEQQLGKPEEESEISGEPLAA